MWTTVNLMHNTTPLDDKTEESDRAYDAPVNALSFNWNTTSIYIRPGLKRGEKASNLPGSPHLFFKKSLTKPKTHSFCSPTSQGSPPPREK